MLAFTYLLFKDTPNPLDDYNNGVYFFKSLNFWLFCIFLVAYAITLLYPADPHYYSFFKKRRNSIIIQRMSEQQPLPVKGVMLETSMGAMVLELYWDHAPKTCKNFYELAKKGYYNGVVFHRIVRVITLNFFKFYIGCIYLMNS